MRIERTHFLVFAIMLIGLTGLATNSFAQVAGQAVGDPPAQIKLDKYGDPLPPGVDMRIGTVRLRMGDRINGVAFSPDGKTIVTAASNLSLTVWDAASGAFINAIGEIGRRSEFKRLRYSRDGKFLAAAGQTGYMQGSNLAIFAMPSGEALFTKDIQAEPIDSMRPVIVNAADFSANGSTVAAVGSKGNIYLFDLPTGAELLKLKLHDGPVNTVRYSPDGEVLATGGDDGIIFIWNPISPEAPRRISPGQGPIASLTFSRSGDRLYVLGEMWIDRSTGSRIDHPGWIGVYDVQSGERLSEVSFDDANPQPSEIEITPDGKMLAVKNLRTRTLEMRSTDSSELEVVWEQPFISGGASGQIAISPDGQRVATGGVTGQLPIWETATGHRVLEAEDVHGGRISALVFSPNGRTIASASDDRTVRTWDTTTGLPIKVLSGQRYGVFGLSYSRDGKKLAVMEQTDIAVWDIDEAATLFRLEGDLRKTRLFTHTFSPDGNQLIISDYAGSGSPNTMVNNDGENRLSTYDLASGELLYSSCPDAHLPSKRFRQIGASPNDSADRISICRS